MYRNYNNLCFSTIAGLLVLSQPVLSVEKTIQPELSLRTFYMDNARVESKSSADEVAGIGAMASANVLRRTEDSSVGLFVRNDSTLNNEDSYDSNDQLASINLSKLYEKAQFGLGAQYVRDTSKTSEIENTGEIGNVRRTSLSSSFNARVQLTEQFSVGGDFSLAKSDYEDNSDGLIGYDSQALSMKLSYRYSEKLSVSLQPSVNDYIWGSRSSSALYANVDPVTGSFPSGSLPIPVTLKFKNESFSYGLGVGIDYQHSEQLKSSFSIGRTKRDSELDLSKGTKSLCQSELTRFLAFSPGGFIVVPNSICENEKSSTEITNFSYSGFFRTERSNISTVASVQFLPTSSGDLNKSTRLDFNYGYRVNETLSVNSNIALSQLDVENRGVVSSSSDFKRRFLNAKLGVSYRVSEFLTLSSSYNYYKIYDYRVSSRNDRNSISFKLSYSPAKIFW